MRTPLMALLECRKLAVTRGGRRLVHGLDFTLAPGEIVALVGPNGAGKSSLLAALAGLLPTAGGEITLAGAALSSLSRRQIARQLGFLPQDTEDPYPATVLETALIGRHPHIGFWRWEAHDDVTKAREALRCMGLADFAEREIASLSGGERRRLALAALLAQAPRVYLLDEPLESLDLAYQARLLDILHGLAQHERVGIVFSLHDLSLAARHADRVILLDGRGAAEAGTPGAVLEAERLNEVYECPVRRLELDGLPFYLVG
ncbi:MAG: ABC transporter ATP-binding protein [Gammaproteobacteria bacterium]